MAVAALAYGAMGACSLLRPSVVPTIFGGAATTPDARTEIRAVYGGLPITIATSLVTDERSTRPMALLSAGMAAGRVVGMVGEARRPRLSTLAFLGVETVLAGLLFSAWRRSVAGLPLRRSQRFDGSSTEQPHIRTSLRVRLVKP